MRMCLPLGLALSMLITACGDGPTSGQDVDPTAPNLAAASSPVDGYGGGGGRASTPSAANQPRDCFWAVRSDPNLFNVFYPDPSVTYWIAPVVIPPGGHVRLDGLFPHSRYMSFHLYSARLEPLDALADVEIIPNGGASQPFDVNADRFVIARDYAVKVVAGVRPDDAAAREPNTLYSFQNLGGLKLPTPATIIMLRVYLADLGRDITGDVGLPKVTLVSADGQEVSGNAACSALERLALPDLTTLINNLPLSDVGINTSAFKHLQWLKFFDLQSALANRFNATPLGPPLTNLLGQTTSNTGGFLSNAHNNYIYAELSQSLGNVVAISGTAPRTPVTRQGAARMGSGDVRYYSFCSNDVTTQRYYDCVYDEQVVRDAQNRFVLAVSTTIDRPANARVECGVTWLNWGPLDGSLILYRHLLAAPQSVFPEASQYIPGPPGSAEESSMGRYFPYGMHTDKAAFEALGCPVNPDAIPRRSAAN